MDTYSFLRELADSWVLLALFAVFASVIAWAYRPGSAPLHEDAGRVPFRHEDAPAPEVLCDPRPAGAPRCANACPDCTCTAPDFLGGKDE